MNPESQNAPSNDEGEIFALRSARLERLQSENRDPYAQTRWNRSHLSSDVHANFDTLENQTISFAGRLKTRRGQGKILFFDGYDSGGKLQLVAKIDVLGEDKMALARDLNTGDILGATGRVFRTQKGEVSLEIHDFTLLAVSLQPMPEKYHGLKDVETRYRQRYADLIANEEVVMIFRKRSQIVREMRAYLDARDFMEVETPMMQALAGGAAARPFETYHNALSTKLYLRIAPELYLKRLVVGGLERVYEINRNFRNEGIDTRHNPEFTMMECYQAYADYEDMMELTEKMIESIALQVNGTTKIQYGDHEIDLQTPWRRATMQELVKEKIGLEIAGNDLIHAFESHIEPNLIQPTFVLDFPVENSPLAKKKNDDARFTYRFEVFAGGAEIGNAFSELNDPIDQAARFRQQAKQKAKGDDEAQAYDDDYIRALQFGLPPTGGLGIGIDRLAMLLTGNESIREVILFPLLRPERHAVNSTAIAEENYDVNSKVMTLKWASGGVYEYHGVSPETYIRFLQSQSKGEFVNKEIKTKYTERKVA